MSEDSEVLRDASDVLDELQESNRELKQRAIAAEREAEFHRLTIANLEIEKQAAETELQSLRERMGESEAKIKWLIYPSETLPHKSSCEMVKCHHPLNKCTCGLSQLQTLTEKTKEWTKKCPYFGKPYFHATRDAERDWYREKLSEAIDELSRLKTENEEARNKISRYAEVFRKYEAIHRTKADHNAAMAVELERVFNQGLKMNQLGEYDLRHTSFDDTKDWRALKAENVRLRKENDGLKARVGEWFSVEDRLPEKDCECWVAWSSGDVSQTRYTFSCRNWTNGRVRASITHWQPIHQPLPPPPAQPIKEGVMQKRNFGT